ncbi:MAG: hypothetical protein QM489_07750 [Candidatus Izemoplasma sp.]
MGIVSVGYEGEDIDLVSQTFKPRIFIKKGYIIATAEKLINESDITLSILNKTNIPSPLGNIIIAEALSGGFIKIAGPSITKDLETVIGIVKSYNPNKILIDGALFRTSLSKNKFSDAVILATSANLNPSIDKTVNETVNFYNILSTNETTCYNKEIITRSNLNKYTFYNNESLLKTADSIDKIIFSIAKFNHLYINGALTANIAEEIINNKNRNTKFEIIVNHSSQIILSDATSKKLTINLVKVSVLNMNNVIFITVNPTSISNYEFVSEELIVKLASKINIPILNVREVNSC